MIKGDVFMFLVFNKDKICAYGISIITVILLFCAASVMITDNADIILTGASAGKLLPVYKVDTKDEKDCFNLKLCLE